MWTNTSGPPWSGWMKPKPFVGLNHFTVPVAIVITFQMKEFARPRWGRVIDLSDRVEAGSGSIRRTSVESNRTENDIRSPPYAGIRSGNPANSIRTPFAADRERRHQAGG